jgi:hypothetical protein
VRLVDQQQRLSHRIGNQPACNVHIEEHCDIPSRNRHTSRGRRSACAVENDVTDEIRGAFGTDRRRKACVCGTVQCRLRTRKNRNAEQQYNLTEQTGANRRKNAHEFSSEMRLKATKGRV